MDNRIFILNIFGCVFIVFFFGCLYTIIASVDARGGMVMIHYFEIVISLLYLIAGIGIIVRKKLGFYLFKFFLYIFLLGFPIGTIIAYKTLAYIKKNDVESLFS